ncbi:phosphomannomutase/phosphoglucomutase [Sphaerisporangium rubeum]|uniref:Phosphomannomutase n=1 Tax=Sphaerisporangium rubeum TaxID=321317 RepID=A0A7X0IBA8_9ACTN|nr:phosphomannomutase [Sphaerisporangium rubeum]
MGDLAKIFKAYDIRGVVPAELDEETAQAIGAAFAEVLGASAVVIARDMRDSSAPLAAAFARGVTATGADVVDAGLGSTDLLYYASGSLELPGVMFTASHNPARYNGLKMCRAGAVAMSSETGLAAVRDRAAEILRDGLAPRAADGPATGTATGTVTPSDLLAGYAAHLRGLVDLSGLRPLRVVVDAGNGMAGHTVPAVFGGLPVEVIPLYFELDGSFPNHEANPLEPQNLLDLRAAVVDKSADLGLAFDGDADRCWVVDERGESVPPSAVTALVATRELARHPGAPVIHNLITSRAVPEIIAEHGGVPVRTRVGHSYIKAEMARTGAVFGGEHSAHYYFRDFWFADSGMLAALHVLAALGEQDGPLSRLMDGFSRYHASGEINSRVADHAAVVARIRAEYQERDGVSVDDLDGITVSGPDWWFNLRPSNTESLLRLNAEAADDHQMAAIRDAVLAAVRS